jgi:hypothetical protein
MTALALRGYSLLKTGFIAALFAWITGHMFAVGRAIQASRQLEANQKIAQLMRHEYPNETYYGVLAILNEKTMKEYIKNVSKD